MPKKVLSNCSFRKYSSTSKKKSKSIMLPDTWVYARTSYFKVLKKAKNIDKVNSAVNLALTSNFQTMRTNLQILYLKKSHDRACARLIHSYQNHLKVRGSEKLIVTN